ncbi:MAG TPA: DUF190 domain-containing protein [Solirubrobacteraceae bacterium]
MSEGALTLTTYFGERSRVDGRLLADELLDMHTRREIRTSILLRGIQGFGAKHRLRTDRLLTLSEDLPLVALAVDTPQRIEALAADIAGIARGGLITLERCRFGGRDASVDDGLPPPPTQMDEPAWRDSMKLTVYLGRHERIDGSPAFARACEILHKSGVAGATVLLGVDGIRHGQRQRARFFARNTGVPLMVMAVGDAPNVQTAVRRLEETLDRPLLTVERVQVCKRDGQLLGAPYQPTAAYERCRQTRQKLTIVTSEAARHNNRSVYLELVHRLRTAVAAGATSLRGIWGFHGDHAPHGDRLLAIRRHVPVVTVAIDTPERIASLFDIVDELTRERGLVTSELVPAASALHSPPAL